MTVFSGGPASAGRVAILRGDFPRQRAELPLQVPNAGFARVFGNHQPQRGVRDLQRCPAAGRAPAPAAAAGICRAMWSFSSSV